MPGNTPDYVDQGGALNHIGSGGELDVDSGGVVDIKSGGALKIAGTTITSTAAEINALAGQGAVAADMAKLHAITATAAEVNVLHSVTAGASTASKAAVLGASQNLDVLKLPVGGLAIGAAGAEVATTVTAAEVNALAGQGVVAADFAKLHAVTVSAADINSMASAIAIATDGLLRLGCARVTFDASIVGNQSTGSHASAVTLPISAVICGGFFDVNTVFHSAGGDAGTIAIDTEGAGDIQVAAAVSGAPYSTIGRKAIVPKANTPDSTSIKCTAARAITFTVAGQVLSAGKLTLFLFYVTSAVSA